MKVSRLVFVPALLLAAGCDAGKAPYNEAATLEEQGKLTEAAAKYDSVCVRAPDSKMCAPARTRAATVRIKLAETAIKDLKFGDAEKILKVVQETGDAASQEKAKTQLGLKDLVQGLAFEKATAAQDKRAAMKDMETVAASGTPIAAKATDWLTKERPPLLLADATAACATKPPTSCLAICDHLTKLHPGTPEAQKAGGLLTTYQAADAERLYPLLVKAEDLLAQCRTAWKANEGKQKCYLNALAADPDNPLAALAYCGESDTKTKDKLQASLDQIVTDIAEPNQTDPLEERFKKACDDGEYEKQTIAKPGHAL